MSRDDRQIEFTGYNTKKPIPQRKPKITMGDVFKKVWSWAVFGIQIYAIYWLIKTFILN